MVIRLEKGYENTHRCKVKYIRDKAKDKPKKKKKKK